LRFLDADTDRSAYVGGGLSWAGVHLGRDSSATSYASGWHGSGLQGEVTAGYELTRRTPIRVFVQADVGLPFFKARSESYTYTLTRSAGNALPPTIISETRYTPSAVVSLGIGWQRH
jgi:hypothetical protein